MGSAKVVLTTVMTVMVLGLLGAPARLQADETLPVLKGVKVFNAGDDVRVEITVDKNFEYTCSKMPQLLRVVVDLPRTEPGRSDTVYKYKSTMISSIRLEKKFINDETITRLSVNLIEDADFTAQTDASDKTKLTLFLRSKPAPVSTAGKAAATPGHLAQGQPAPGKPAAPTAPAPRVPSPVVAGTSQPVTVTGVSCGANSIEIESGGDIDEFKAFTLQRPGRLVIDIPGARSTLGPLALPANRFGVSKARLGYFEKKLRLVFDSGSKPFPGHEVVKTGAGLRIVFRASAEGK